MGDAKLKPHPLVFVSFLLCVLVFCLPTAADLVFGAWIHDGPAMACIVMWLCTAIVLVPLILGTVLTKRYPEKYRKRKLATVVWAIVLIA